MQEAERAREWLEAGLAEAQAIGDELLRGQHLAAWQHRISALEPARAAQAAVALPEAADRAELLQDVIRDRVRLGLSVPEAEIAALLRCTDGFPASARVQVLNLLSETALTLAQHDREGARAIAGQLLPEAQNLPSPADEVAAIPGPHPPPPSAGQSRALGCALVGETLMVLDDPRGRACLEEAAALARDLNARDAILGFVAGAFADADPEYALQLAAEVEEPAERLAHQARLLARLDDTEQREARALALAQEALEPGSALAGAEQPRDPQVLARIAQEVAPVSTTAARVLLDAAREDAAGSPAQLRALQWTGIAGLLAVFDREASEALFRHSVEAAAEEPEAVKRATTWVVIANEMANPFPQEAAAVFARAVREAGELEATWELAHFLELVFQAERSEFLDIGGVRPLLDRIQQRVRDDDLRIPGLFGLPDVARCMVQLDGGAAETLLREWFAAARETGDTDGLAQAAMALQQFDPDGSTERLRVAREFFERRVDCTAMADFARLAAPIAPELVLESLDRIVHEGDRTEALISAGVHLLGRDPAAARSHIASLGSAEERSIGYLTGVDHLLGTGDRPRP